MDLVGTMWEIRCEPQVHVRFKRVFERVSKASRDGVITITDTPENCNELAWFCKRYPLVVPKLRYLNRRAKQHEKHLTLVARILAGQKLPRVIELTKPAYAGQLVAAELALTQKRLLLADRLGAGKTISALCMVVNPETRPALVVTLTDLPQQWEQRIAEFTPHLKVYSLKLGQPFGNHPTRGYGPQDLARQIERGAPVPDVIISNYAKLSGWTEYLLHLGIKSVTFDEIQELRTGSGARYAAAEQLTHTVDYALGLSATPIYNYGAEVYNVVALLFPEAFGSYDEFAREWTTTTANGKLGIAEPDALGRYLREQGYMLRRSASEITGKELSEPRSIVHRIDANLSALEQMTSDAAQLARIITAKTGVTNSQRFRAAGEFDYRLRRATGVAKAPYVAAFAKLLLQSEERLLLFAWHHDVYAIYREALSEYKPVFFSGQESQAQRHLAKAAFCGGDARIMCMSLRAGAGLDGLQEFARVCLFGELDWSPRIHDQCVGRLARPGQTDEVLAYYPICEHGADPGMVDALGIKESISHGILEPDAPTVEPLTTSGTNIRQLAERYLAQIEGHSRPAPTGASTISEIMAGRSMPSPSPSPFDRRESLAS